MMMLKVLPFFAGVGVIAFSSGMPPPCPVGGGIFASSDPILYDRHEVHEVRETVHDHLQSYEGWHGKDLVTTEAEHWEEFRAVDLNGDNVLDLEDFTYLIRHNFRNMECMPSAAYIELTFANRAGVDGVVSKAEWRGLWEAIGGATATTESRIADAQKKLNDRLEKHDTNGDGQLDASDLPLHPAHPAHPLNN